MKISASTQKMLARVSHKDVKLGDLRAIAKEIKKDHGMAMELWGSGNYFARQLAILIMDKKMLSPEITDLIIAGISKYTEEERLSLIDWFMANQLMKDKNTVAQMESWEKSNDSLKRRVFWYYQGRLRWVGQTPPPNTEELLTAIEKNMEAEKPEVQWAMNFTAAQIGIFQPGFRNRCIALGKRVGLYKDEIVHKNCTPNYLPELIAIQVAKLKK